MVECGKEGGMKIMSDKQYEVALGEARRKAFLEIYCHVQEMRDKQYEVALGEARRKAFLEIYCHVQEMRDALPKSSITKINAFGAVLLLLDPSSGVPYVQPRTRVTQEEHAAVVGASHE
jgi:hypothetical protein